ncbi:FKBP-type peptidyl-prolyl cis-trans isomerase domain-containing protein, partial [Tanacetum coccineum]
ERRLKDLIKMAAYSGNKQRIKLDSTASFAIKRPQFEVLFLSAFAVIFASHLIIRLRSLAMLVDRSTIRRWKGEHQIEVWEAHKAPIQAVKALPLGELITAPHRTTLEVPNPGEAVDYPQRSQFEEKFKDVDGAEHVPMPVALSSVSSDNPATKPTIAANDGTKYLKRYEYLIIAALLTILLYQRRLSTFKVKSGCFELMLLQIWETAGQERFQSLGVAFYRDADCYADSKNVKALYQRAKAYIQLVDLDLAEMDIKKALEIDPDNMLSNLGLFGSSFMDNYMSLSQASRVQGFEDSML